MTVFRFLPVALVLALAACDIKVNDGGVSIDVAEGTARDEWSRTYTLEPGGHFEIVNVNGAITARPASGNRVEVVARREARTPDEETSRALLKKIEMVEDFAPGRVKIEAKADWDGSFAGGMGRRSQVSIGYEVSIPPGLQVNLRTENGGIRLENVSGSLRARSTNGGITGQGVSGSLVATTVNGGIQVGFGEITGDVEVATVNGGVRLELPSDVKADLDARAVNGGVSVDEGLKLDATETARLHVAGRLNGGGPRIAVQTTNGGVRVQERGSSE